MIGERLKKLRIETGKSQQEVCESLSIEQGTLANYENERRTPKIDMVIKLADFFNVSTDYLLGRTDTKETIEYNFPNKKISEIISQRLTMLVKDYSSTETITENEIKELADFCKITLVDFTNYINGSSIPSLFELNKLADVLNTSLDFLLGKTEKMYKNISYDESVFYESDFAKVFNRITDGFLETEISNLLDVSIAKIVKLKEKIDVPTPEILEKIAQAFGKSTDYLLGLTSKSRPAGTDNLFPFCMDSTVLHRIQEILGPWNPADAEHDCKLLDLTYDEYYVFYHYGFMPHISVLRKICEQHGISADYLLNFSNSKLSIATEEKLLQNYRQLDELRKEKIMGLISSELLQQNSEKYMKLYNQSVAADEELKEAK